MHTMARLFMVGLAALLIPALAGAATRPVFLVGQLSDSALIRLSSAVAARPDAVLLVDSLPLSPFLRHFLAEYRPDQVIPVGRFPDGAAGLTRRLGVAVEPIVPWPGDPAGVVPREAGLTHRFDSVIVSPASPREQFLRAACLAGTSGAPLWLHGGDASEEKKIADFLGTVQARQVILVGKLEKLRINLPGVTVRRLASRSDLDAACIEQMAMKARIDSVVVTNPADLDGKKGGMSALAPWLAVQKRAGLLCTREDGKDAAVVVEQATRTRAMRGVESVIFLGNHQAIPVWQRPNPIPKDKDPFIEMEPLTPLAGKPFSYAVGRLFHADRAVVPLMLARQRLAVTRNAPRKALVASNPGGGLPLLETFSRHTAEEMHNRGFEVNLLAGHGLTAAGLREAMPGQDMILWEGHHNTLIKDWGFIGWDEPMSPAFVCLQSCLALQDFKVQPLLSRGAYAVVGTSTRTYSGSGGAFSLAYFNGLLHDEQTLGGSLRQAKNFLLAYARLKEKRLAGQAKRTGANYRAAWAFTLWGDPTFRPGMPETPIGGRTAVRHTVTGNALVLDLPERRLDRQNTDRYTTHVPPNSRLAGLVRKTDKQTRTLVPMVFAEVYLPKAKGDVAPRLRSRLPASKWVFLWDARRKTGYLLAMPSDLDAKELRFRIDWPAVSVANPSDDVGSGS